ncbi:MAG TPA: carboxypeptidase-like regulatory domain-containing protein, partial [Puia sp.]|nr:carboxypeptidase-like regulatory domain-containing protein [Puia sp.]
KKTGIEGYIFRISGNRMPSPDTKLSPPKGIKAVLYVYQLTSLGQVTRQGESAFYTSIGTKLVQTVTSDENGYFFLSLPPGEYSLFTKKDALFYANNFDSDNHIAPVKVVAHKVTQVNFNIDYDAVY